MGKVCFLFGNRNTPEDMAAMIEKAAAYLYDKFDARVFTVGQYGHFDAMAASAINRLKERYPDITLLQVIPYHPSERPTVLHEGCDSTFYPEGMESVPRKFAIVRANEYMIKNCDCAICYVKYVGNSKKLLDKLYYRGIPTLNLAEEHISCHFV